jgi:hypothetical protein
MTKPEAQAWVKLYDWADSTTAEWATATKLDWRRQKRCNDMARLRNRKKRELQCLREERECLERRFRGRLAEMNRTAVASAEHD